MFTQKVKHADLTLRFVKKADDDDLRLKQKNSPARQLSGIVHPCYGFYRCFRSWV